MSARYYINRPLALGPITLVDAEAHHLAVVCRVRQGAEVYLFNGDDREYRGVVREVGRRAAMIEILSVDAPEREVGRRIVIAAPLPKGDRGHFLIEKLTEIGVTQYVPIRTERSVTDSAMDKTEKLRRYVVEASKQCGRNVLMQIAEPVGFEPFCQQYDLPTVRWLADRSGEKLGGAAHQDVVGAVGPEGGFTAGELDLARAAGWRVVGLSPRILRVETAALQLAWHAIWP